MSSPEPPPPPPPPQKPLHYFDMPEWPTKKRTSGSRPPRLSRRAQQSASLAAKCPPTEKGSTIFPWMKEDLSSPHSTSSSHAPRISGKGSWMDLTPTGKNSESDDLSGKNTVLQVKIPSLGCSWRESLPLGHEKAQISPCDASEFYGTNIPETESTCIDVLKNGLHEGNFTKDKTVEKSMPKTLGEKNQDSKFEASDSSFLQVVNKFVADLSATINFDNQDATIAEGVAENDFTRTRKKENNELVGSSMILRPRQHQKPIQIEKSYKESGASYEDQKGSDKNKGKMQQNTIDKNKDTSKNKSKNTKDKKKEESKKEIKWPKFRLELTPEEIEEDLYAMTGKKPPWKIKKRPKNVQKNIDDLALGAQLEYITPDSYEVNENPRKGK